MIDKKFRVRNKIHNNIKIGDIAYFIEFQESTYFNEKTIRLKFRVKNINYYTRFFNKKDNGLNLLIDDNFECIKR